MAKIKISVFTIIFVMAGCVTVIKKQSMSWQECIKKCVDISRENDKDNLLSQENAEFYLLYLCARACEECATDEEIEQFKNGFNQEEDKKEYI